MQNQTVKPEQADFLAQNQSELAELLTFIDFALGLTIGFIEANQERDKALLVAALRAGLADTDCYLQVMDFSQEPKLRRLREAMTARLQSIPTGRKLVILILGLEAAIGTDGVGAYPPVLQDLNFVRNAYRETVPHPLLFVLPDYALTRVSQYAPDFWAWQSGLFRFKSSAQAVEQLRIEAFERPLLYIPSDDNRGQIEQLKRLLMELNPSGKPIAPQDVPQCCELYYKIGSAYRTQKQPERARDYLNEGLTLLAQHPNPTLEQDFYRKLGHAYEDLRQFDAAIAAYTTALDLARANNRSPMESMLLHDLGNVALEQRQFDQAKAHYQQALDIDIEFGDRYNQASTYHQLGMVAQEQRHYEQAQQYYQQALDLFIEFGDRYGQASTYYQLGQVAEETGDADNARAYYIEDLRITVEFNDEHGLGISLRNLARFYQATQNEAILTESSQILNITSDELRQTFEQNQP